MKGWGTGAKRAQVFGGVKKNRTRARAVAQELRCLSCLC